MELNDSGFVLSGVVVALGDVRAGCLRVEKKCGGEKSCNGD